jgi:hypothetical protein
MPSFLPSILGSDEDATRDPVGAMPVHALIGVLRDLGQDLDSVELEEAEYETILAEIEELDRMVPGREAEHKVEAYPPDERTVEWLDWLADRLEEAEIEETDLHKPIEELVLQVSDTIDEILPFDPSTDTDSWEYQFIELDTEKSGHYEMLSKGVTYDILAEALEKFRDDHRDRLEEEASDEEPSDVTLLNLVEEPDEALDTAGDLDEEDQSLDTTASSTQNEGLEPSVITEDGEEVDPVETTDEESSEASEESDDQDSFTDRISGLTSGLDGLKALAGSDDTSDSNTAGDATQAESLTADSDGLSRWKLDLLEADPDPEDVDEETVEHLIEAGYLEIDGDTPDVEAFAGPDAREMLEIHDERPNDPVWLGRGSDGRGVPVNQASMFLHMMIAGKTGFGKSTQLFNMALQTIRAGYGCVIYDPGGDDSKELMEKIPEDRLDDVIWIEPGREEGYSTGFNFLQIGLDEDDLNYDKAVENLVNDLAKTLGQSQYWGPVMDRVSRSFIRAMNASKHDFNLLDLNYILLNQESRERFRDIVEEEGIDWLDDSMAEMAQKDDEDLEPLRRRFEEWKENPIARRLIAFRDGGVNIPEAVEDDKIIIVRMGSEQEDLKQMLMMAVLRRVWAAIRSREDEDARHRDPFFVYMDEFHNLVPDDSSDSTIPNMFREARKYRLSLIVSDQYYSEIPDNVITGVYNNTNTVLSFNPGYIDQAREIAPSLDVDPQTLINEGKYRSWTRLTTRKGNKTPAFKVNNLPPYPPIRRREEAENLIEQSLREYGRELSTESIKSEMKFKAGRGELEVRGVAGDESTTAAEYEKQDEELRDTLFESIYVTQIKQDAKGEFVPMDAVEEEWDRRADLGYQSKPAQILEKTAEQYVVQENRSDGLYVRITPDGLKEAGLQQDTGENASGGGKMHRWVLTQAFECFTVWDCFVELPDQSEEGELPDGVADLPIDPLEPAKDEDDLKGVKNALGELETEYPELFELTGGRNIAIEAETRTIADPQQTLTNLRKAVNNGKVCVLAVKPPTEGGRAPDGAEFDYWAERGEQIIYKTDRNGTHVKSIDRDEITCVRQTTEEGHRQFYNASAMTLEDEDVYPLRPASEENVEWWEHDDVVVVETANREEIAWFEDVWALEEPDKSAFPAYAVRENGGITVYEGGTTHEYEDMDMMKEDWQTISEPFIPELEFNRGLPSKEDFVFVVYPFADSEYDEPMIVEGEQRQPLIPEDRSMPTGEATPAEDREPPEEDEEGEDPDDPDATPTPEDETSGDEPDDTDDSQRILIDAQPKNQTDVTPIEELSGGTAAICGVIQSSEPPTTVRREDEKMVDPMQQITIEDDTGEIQARLWGRHAEFDADEGKEILIAGAVVSSEVKNGSMTQIVDVHASDTIVDAPDSISSGLSTDQPTAGTEPVAVSDGAIDQESEQRGVSQEADDQHPTERVEEAERPDEGRIFEY